MAPRLIIKEITPHGSSELARLSDPHVIVGRDPAAGMVLAVEGVSRIHGSFIQGEAFWLYADEGSTNGSWLNGQRLTPAQWRVLRSGDMMQLADLMLQVQEEGGAPNSARALIAVDAEGVYAEFPLPEAGEALVLGGQNGDLLIDDSDFVEPLAVVEVRDRSVLLQRHRTDTSIKINGIEAGDQAILKDNDCLQVGLFQIVLADPAEPRAIKISETYSEGGAVSPPQSGSEQGPENRTRTVSQIQGVFGKSFIESDAASTQAITPEQLAQARRGYARIAAEAAEAKEESSKYSSMEDTIILVLGVGLVGVLLGFGIWWFLR